MGWVCWTGMFVPFCSVSVLSATPIQSSPPICGYIDPASMNLCNSFAFPVILLRNHLINIFYTLPAFISTFSQGRKSRRARRILRERRAPDKFPKILGIKCVSLGRLVLYSRSHLAPSLHFHFALFGHWMSTRDWKSCFFVLYSLALSRVHHRLWSIRYWAGF